MEPNKILGADILDILFEGRNKEYGAYELRKTYNKRLARAMAAMCSMILLLFLSGFVKRHGETKTDQRQIADIDLTAAKIPDPTPPPTPPPVPKAPPIKTVIFTAPKIIVDSKVDEPPPDQTTLDSVRIGKENKDGGTDIGLAGPPLDVGNKGLDVPSKQPEEDNRFIPIEKESEFPGGAGAWLRFLKKNLRTPDDAINNEISGTVVVKFMVDPDGNISDVEVISGPEHGGLREEAVRVIRKSGKWTPALQNGRYVKSYKQQAIQFVLENQ